MTRYIRSRHLEVESEQGDAIVLIHGRLGHRLRLSRPTVRFLELFAEPLSLEDLGRMGSLDKALPAFRTLRRARFLVEEGHPETLSDRLLRQVNPGLFGCPSPREATERAEVTFFGVPFDLGNTLLPGARFGPAALRRVAQAHFRPYTTDLRTQVPRGWYDNDRERELLAGISLQDAGDLFSVPNEAPSTVFAKLREVVADILATGSFPVALGGDHSMTYPILAAFDQPLEVVQIDAHPDLAEYFAGEEHHHGNFMSRALQLEHVTGIHQVGLRGVTVVPQVRRRGKIRQALTPRRLREMGIAAFVDSLPGERDYYVTFDIDSLDPVHAPGTSTPLPGGLTYDEVKDLLIAVASCRRCVGFDLVELNPQRDTGDLTAITALELLLAFLGACFARRPAGGGGEEP